MHHAVFGVDKMCWCIIRTDEDETWMQIAVLKGATSVIEDCKPVIWIELIGAEFAETNTILTNYGYRMDKLGKSDFIYFP